ncbi:DMT family transporter [Allokutzneria albata]|uniref:Magnesium transporter NIPA n=1 Tax=Allokutzneria albata TaxID=211114 RepID=A0A1H0DMC1_ALLAB|nr:DMT family transporter [Allokutzneria albata]SDN71305.1 hypothetical protein SAMN04489726_7889 [Allokutzneria albata]
MELTVPAVVLAALGACCYAAAARLQHSAVRATGSGETLKLASLLGLLRDRRWLLGLSLLVGGTVLHAVAVAIGPLIVVQPVGVLALVLAAVLDARQSGRSLTPQRLAPALTATLGMGAFVVLAAGNTGSALPPLTAVTDALLISTGLLAVLVLLGALSAGGRRCLALGVAGGVAYGLISVLIRLVAQRFQLSGEIDPLALLGILAALLIGGWCVQQAYASGPPHMVVACLTVVDPLVAVGMGVGLLGEAAGTDPGIAALELVCAAVALAGVTLIALRDNENSAPPGGPGPGAPDAERVFAAAHATSPLTDRTEP